LHNVDPILRIEKATPYVWDFITKICKADEWWKCISVDLWAHFFPIFIVRNYYWGFNCILYNWGLSLEIGGTMLTFGIVFHRQGLTFGFPLQGFVKLMTLTSEDLWNHFYINYYFKEPLFGLNLVLEIGNLSPSFEQNIYHLQLNNW
jgi:hypothetical protein